MCGQSLAARSLWLRQQPTRRGRARRSRRPPFRDPRSAEHLLLRCVPIAPLPTTAHTSSDFAAFVAVRCRSSSWTRPNRNGWRGRPKKRQPKRRGRSGYSMPCSGSRMAAPKPRPARRSGLGKRRTIWYASSTCVLSLPPTRLPHRTRAAPPSPDRRPRAGCHPEPASPSTMMHPRPSCALHPPPSPARRPESSPPSGWILLVGHGGGAALHHRQRRPNGQTGR